MGRKIPARKHFGVRDILKQNEEKLALIKDKINNPPEKRDFQKVSHSLARFIKLKEAAKQQSSQPVQKNKLKRSSTGHEDKPENFTKKSKKPHTEARNDKDCENLHQRPKESDASFMRRVNRVTKESVEEAKFEAKYGVEVIRDKKTGEIKLKKRPTNEIDERLKQNAINAKKKGKARPSVVIPAEERNKLAKAMVKEKKQKESEAKTPAIQEFKRDEFKFGEVVNQPPQLTVPRRAKKAETVSRPGEKSLLLRSVIEEYSTTEKEKPKEKEKNIPQKTTVGKPKVSLLKGKRKELSVTMRKMIDEQQTNVIKLYKELKKNQRIQNKT